MKGQSRAARVIPSRGIDQQHVGHPRQCPYRGFEQRPLAQREQPRVVRSSGSALDDSAAQDSRSQGERCTGPTGLTGHAAPANPAREADETTTG